MNFKIVKFGTNFVNLHKWPGVVKCECATIEEAQCKGTWLYKQVELQIFCGLLNSVTRK